jgi:hypothetical protein
MKIYTIFCLFLFFSVYAVTVSGQTNINVGNTVAPSGLSNAKNYIIADKYTTTSDMDVSSITTNGSDAGSVVVAIYDDLGDKPNNKISTTEVTYAVTSGVKTTSITGHLSKGIYWIVFNSTTSGNATKMVGGNTSIGTKRLYSPSAYSSGLPSNANGLTYSDGSAQISTTYFT